MNVSLVMTVMAPDRPGLVELIARQVADHGGNWVESRMAHLSGQFAGILRVEIDAASADSLTRALRDLEPQDITLVVHPDRDPVEATTHKIVELDLLGQDHPGIVSEVSKVLSSLSVNVEELQTECRTAATTGQTLFHASARLGLPDEVSPAQLRQRLEDIAADLMVEIHVDEPTDDA